MFPCSGFRRGGGAVQRDAVRASVGGKHGRDVLHRQRSALRHLLPNSEIDDADIRRSQSPRQRRHVRSHLLP